MKLKFELKKQQIEYLYRILQLVHQIWGSTDKIYFYFDTDCMIIYPADKGGFGTIYARIHIFNSPSEHSGNYFFNNYTIKSQKDKNAILISPQSLSQFIENLKVLVDLNYEAQFKLTQSNMDNEIKKYIDITGSTPQSKDVVRCFIEINCFFDQALYPEEITKKEVNFQLDSGTCQNVLAKFASRYSILQDNIAKIVFKSKNGGDSQDASREYEMELSSKHIKSKVENRGYQAIFTDQTDMKGKYSIKLKKDTFTKFFSVLKVPGTAFVKIDNGSQLEMEYTIEKCSFIQVILETRNQNIPD